MGCKLCKNVDIPYCYYEDDRIKICDCEKCKSPIGALKNKSEEITDKEMDYMWEKALQIFGSNIVFLFDHKYWHVKFI